MSILQQAKLASDDFLRPKMSANYMRGNQTILDSAMLKAFIFRKNYSFLYNVTAGAWEWNFESETADLNYLNPILIEQDLIEQPVAVGYIEGTDVIVSGTFVPQTEERNFNGDPVGRIMVMTRRMPNPEVYMTRYVIIHDSISSFGWTSAYETARTIIWQYAQRLTEAMMASRSNLRQTTKPLIIETDTDTKLSMENLVQNMDDMMPFIFVERGAKVEEAIKTFSTEVTPLFLQHNEYCKRILEEFYEFRGLSSGTTKKERQTEAETMARIQTDSAPINAFLWPREYACDQMKTILGITATVSPRTVKEINGGEYDVFAEREVYDVNV